jgi:two-component system phosphate regulon sensor histidine kinase PhoR
METTTVVLLVFAILLAAISITLFVKIRSRKSKVKELSETLEQLETRNKALESELGIEREKLKAIFDTESAAITILDRERHVTTINKTAAKLFRITVEAARGKPFISLVRDHEMDNIVQKCLDTNQKQAEFVQPTGSRQYYELAVEPLSNGTLVLVRDITNIRKLEKVRQDFIANISHELRTPIASCKAIVETLQGGAINDKNISEDFLQRMQVETEKLAQMVNELGELSRIESGELELKLERVNLAEVLAKVIDRLKAQADRAQLGIKLVVPSDLPSVIGDTNRIEQVAVNLVHNAIKFTPQNGRIIISPEIHDNMVWTSIQDTGIGIPEDDLTHIFERFYKVDKARSGGGTGLGLAIAKHIIQAHGGDIWVESKEGKGSTFIFSLPIASS